MNYSHIFDRHPLDSAEEEEEDALLEPLDITYAQAIVANAKELERVQLSLELLPKPLLNMLDEETDAVLYGVATAVEALHELAGNAVRIEASNVIADEELAKNMPAQIMARESGQFVALMEALGYYACNILVERHKADLLAKELASDDEFSEIV